jgi:hypothetical protein
VAEPLLKPIPPFVGTYFPGDEDLLPSSMTPREVPLHAPLHTRPFTRAPSHASLHTCRFRFSSGRPACAPPPAAPHSPPTTPIFTIILSSRCVTARFNQSMKTCNIVQRNAAVDCGPWRTARHAHLAPSPTLRLLPRPRTHPLHVLHTQTVTLCACACMQHLSPLHPLRLRRRLPVPHGASCGGPRVLAAHLQCRRSRLPRSQSAIVNSSVICARAAGIGG